MLTKNAITNSDFGFCTSVYSVLMTALPIGVTGEDVAARICFSKMDSVIIKYKNKGLVYYDWKGAESRQAT